MSELGDNLALVQDRVMRACAATNRDPGEITLIAVSKGHSLGAIRELVDLGVTNFGESYVQEWRAKVDALPDLSWHFIGHLQSNKAKYVVGRTRLIHSVDRESLMDAIDQRATAPEDVLLQINVGEDPAKFGADPGAVIATLQAAMQRPRLNVRGLMTIPPFTDEPEDARPHFQALASAFEMARTWIAEHHPDRLAAFCELSMGMTADFDIAIEEGATMIRVGTALFGERSYE